MMGSCDDVPTSWMRRSMGAHVAAWTGIDIDHIHGLCALDVRKSWVSEQ